MHKTIIIILDRDAGQVTWYLFDMSERWGFDLSMEAVRLLRHRSGEWQEFVVQKLEGDDIEARLADLVARVETPASVDIFLPRDQILYTDVKVASDTPDVAEINAAMEGRTPYDLADLEIDWATTAPGTARVAAIARQTLDEAEAFVTKGGLTVRAFSSLATPDDFPRPPVFVERAAIASEDGFSDDEPAAAAFSTGRKTVPPLMLKDAPNVTAVDDGPVVKVDDPTPVLQLPETELPPLNPGTPLPRPTSQPRVVTNVGASAAAARAASLTATPSVEIRHRDRALPTPALAAIAAVLSIVIAIVIWTILPSTPETSLVSPEANEATTPADVQIAEVAPPPVEDTTPEASPLPSDIADVSDTPSAPVLPETAPAFAWATIPAPNAATPLGTPTDLQAITVDPRPAIAWLEPRPGTLDAIEDYMPVAFVPDGITILDSPGLGTIAAFEPISSSEGAASLIAPADEGAALLPTVETEAPEVYVAPVEEATPQVSEATEPNVIAEETQLAALESTVSNTRPVTVTAAEIAAPLVTQPPEPEPEVVETVAPEALGPVELTQTELAAALPDTAPRRRPSEFMTEIERQKFGDRTRDELGEIRPGTRPQSAQIEALVARAGNPPSDLAVATSASPRGKPRDFDAIVASGLIQLQREREARTVATLTPDTSGAIEAALADEVAAQEATRPQNSPRLAIPSNVSVARQATVEEAISLNRINLVGVFGRPSDRRALVRLPSGRYVKVQVGDRVDGGIVAGISDSALQYQKGGRTISLAMPQG